MIELLGTNLTLIGLIPRMLALMVTERYFVWETFATSAALKRFLALVVGGAVLRQVTHAIEQFTAVLTPEGSFGVDAATGAAGLARVHGSL